ncbi:MAG: substrate-binding periplasmic protein [Shewanella sp.]|uniref:Transporter substrate-binding domain-containing protein n=1 Tax=Shewanella cutis TaxID=2766780 RepID=A0ABS9QY31_9GAMM|nr:transporter substrate-binding domain-containing protein [Shewanella sp. PS-2]MCG9964351.1 transporter substrate-binding domain-containing protein [Shewanella sp. PS-2]
MQQWNLAISNSLIGLLCCFSAYASDIAPSPTTPSVQDKPTITMAFFEDPKNSFYIKWAELLYTHAFTQLGYQFNYEIVPAIRASKMLESGKIDGEPGRIFSYGDKVNNVVRIEEPFIETHLIAFTTHPQIKITDWQSLTNMGYKVEYYRGMIQAKQKLTELIPATHLSESSSPINSFRKLLHDRIDIYIDSEVSLHLLQKTPEFQDGKIRPVAYLESVTNYGYLHKRHSQLAVDVAKQLKKMKQEGLFEYYKQQAQTSFEDHAK